MGSIDTFDTFDEGELTVLVTGFGPFKQEYPINPSWEIAKSLPEYLPLNRVKDPAHRSSSKFPRVRLVVPPAPVRVNYEVVRELVPSFWDKTEPKVDFVLHIGMAGPADVYSMERRGHRDGYKMKDVDGNFLNDEERHEREGDKWIWHDMPEELVTNLDVADIYKRWVDKIPKYANVRISEDPGRYLCDFIYFSSLAHLYKQQRPRKVLFLHVPAIGSKEMLRTGTELATQLIKSIIESELNKKESVGEL
ncbi:putative pyroglutamyl peptidase type I [Pseudomassariella vexata]|uniref:Putative pyroglutamyl peptidase type I n=1 Tax=Pseudomassariella vexata TaxID=1141098 RepID=A0A1Y2DSX6_9PEZI|nr:putative pyroglutamyl peptidase type I [Pseudomassariella vexata]ORY62269.1 putative pyroglutamyl peptidase type I [Pseudomassariella vexata]